ncbi:hypothetical protein P3T43_003601 [Paraburkholderia sp. GAS41]|jgi:hypothetical protein
MPTSQTLTGVNCDAAKLVREGLDDHPASRFFKRTVRYWSEAFNTFNVASRV